MIRRLLVLAAQFLLVTEAAFGVSLPMASPAAATQDVSSPSGAATRAPTPGAANAGPGACTVTSGPTGAVMTSCPTAGSYADVVAGMQVAMSALRGAADTGSLHVESDPVGATVSVNGIDSGVTPLDLPVPAGTYFVRISADGYTPFSHVVAVAAGAPTSLSKKLDTGGSGNVGSYQWVRPASILGQLGPAGHPDGSFDITGYVRDKDGADYVSFVNGGSVTVNFDKPTGYDSSFFYDRWLAAETKGINTTGIAKSTDDGKTWTVLKSWADTYTAKTWTSNQFNDGRWSGGDPGPVTNHWLRVSYHQWHYEQTYVDAMVPRADGGISVYTTKIVNDQPQDIVVIWDNLPDKYCRPDDTGPQCIGIEHPSRYWGTPFTNVTTGTYSRVPSDVVMARWGISQQDLATYNVVRTSDTAVFSTATGSEASISADPLAMTYEGSFKDSDYFLAMDGNTNNGVVYVAHNGGLPTQQSTYNLGPDAPSGRTRAESLAIGKDGTLYVLDHSRGWVYRLDNGKVVLLGSPPPGIYGGIAGAAYGPSAYNYLSAAVDSAGNVHTSFRVGVVQPGTNSPTSYNVYYEVFPAQKVSYDSVALFTEPSCPACDAAKAWLIAAGVAFRENPTDLPRDVAGSVAAAESSKGYPVVARLGADNVVIGGATTADISMLLGATYPILVDTHPAVWGVSSTGMQVGVAPDWVLTILENDQPRVVDLRPEGVMAFTPSGGSWVGTKVLSAPPPVPVVEMNTTDGATTAYQPMYPMFPGGSTTGSAATALDVPFNTFAKVSDLRFLYRGGDGARTGQQSYTLNTTKPGETSDTYRVVESVSQLVPAAAFYVALGAAGTVTPVEGELAQYVKSQDVVTSNGYRFAKIVVDLRAKDITEKDGNISGQTVGGAVTVEAKGPGGTPESRSISLILLVQNTRLRTQDPNSRAASLDVTSEAVHFMGPNEHWVVTNNTALPNTVTCGKASIMLPPNSATTIPATTVLAGGPGKCFAGLEVAPTVLDGCSSWDDAQLVLAAQTIDSLAASLPLRRAENVTNWELSYGSRTATVYRLISLDKLAGTPGAPSCATAVSDKSAAVVQITGTFLGSGEAYTPTVSVVDSGTTAIQTASLASPGTIAFEREWLTFEATYLEADLSVAAADEAFASLMTLNRAVKRWTYERQLLAVEALLSCNYDGVGIFSVQDLLLRTSLMPDSLRETVACLNDFALDPRRHWPEYTPKYWAGGAYDATFLGTLIDDGVTANPTLSWLAATARGQAADYGTWVAAHAKGLAAKAAAVDLIGPATDFELDDYGRIATAASKDLGGLTGPVLRAAAITGPLERTELKVVMQCVQTMTGARPLEQLVQLTSTRSYPGGIPCVDARAGAQAQTDRYQMLALGLRGGTFSALWQAAGRDFDLVMANLTLISAAIDQVTAAEGRWPDGTTIGAFDPKLSPLDRLEIAVRAMGTTVAARGHQVSTRDAIVGLTECGIGLVKSLPEAFIVIGASEAATFLSPVAGAIGGVIFLGFGTSVTYLSAKDLAAQWTSMDMTAKTAGVCGMAVNAIFAVKGAVDGPFLVYRGYKAWNAAALRVTPPKTIDVATIEPTGIANGLSFEEQGAITAPMGETIAEPAVVAPPVLDPALEAVIGKLPPGPQQTLARTVVEQLGYNDMPPFEQDIVRKMLASTDSPFVTVFKGSGRYGYNSAEYQAWQRVGSAVTNALDINRPKSMSVAVEPPVAASANGAPAKPVRASGADETVYKGADNAAKIQQGAVPPPAEGTPERVAYDAMMQSRQPYLLEAVLGSERLAKALQDPTIKSLYTPEEAASLLSRARAANNNVTPAFYTELSSARFLTALRTAVKAATDLAGQSGNVTSVNSKLFSPGKNKVAAQLTVNLDSGGQVNLVVLKGAIASAEAGIYTKLGPDGITPRLLAPLLENVDGAQALMVTEFAPSTVGGDIIEKVAATNDPGYASAIGSLIARIWFKTKTLVGSVEMAGHNRDLHMGNINVDQGVTPAVAKVVDFDPSYTTQAPEDGFYLTDMFTRHLGTPNETMEVWNYNGYLDGIVGEYAAETGSPAAGYDLLRRMAAEAGTAEGQASVIKTEPAFGVWNTDTPGALGTLGKSVSETLKTYLASKGQSYAPGVVFASAVAPGRPGAATPLAAGWAVLTAGLWVVPRRRDGLAGWLSA